AAVYQDRLWVLGGWSNHPSRNWNDVWHTTDGERWEQLETETVWPPRHEHSVYVFQDRLWVAGGMLPPLANDVWYLELPPLRRVQGSGFRVQGEPRSAFGLNPEP